MNIKGLANVCREIAGEIGIPDVMVNKVNKGAIKEAIKNIDKAERRLEMQNSKKVGVVMSGLCHRSIALLGRVSCGVRLVSVEF